MSLGFVYAIGDVSGLAYFNTIDENLQYNRGCYFPVLDTFLDDYLFLLKLRLFAMDVFFM